VVSFLVSAEKGKRVLSVVNSLPRGAAGRWCQLLPCIPLAKALSHRGISVCRPTVLADGFAASSLLSVDKKPNP